MATSTTNMKKLVEYKDRLANQISKYKEKATETMGVVVQTTEIGVAAFGFGVMRGKFQDPNLMGVPIDLMAGLGLHVLGFFGGAGQYSSHSHNFGDGALASYLTSLGVGIGANWGKNNTSTKGIETGAAPQLGAGTQWTNPLGAEHLAGVAAW